MLLDEVRGGYGKSRRARRCYWRKSEEDIARAGEPGDAIGGSPRRIWQESQEMPLDDVREGYSKIRRARRCYWTKSEEDMARSGEPGDAIGESPRRI